MINCAPVLSEEGLSDILLETAVAKSISKGERYCWVLLSIHLIKWKSGLCLPSENVHKDYRITKKIMYESSG